MSTETCEMEISFEHLNPLWIDVDCIVELEVYNGSNYDDDPSELDILKITFNQDDEECGIQKGYVFYKGGKLDAKVEDRINEIYFNDNPPSSPLPHQITAWRHGY